MQSLVKRRFRTSISKRRRDTSRFFFDLISTEGEIIERDIEGEEFADLEAAIHDAEMALTAMVEEGVTAVALVIRDPDNRLLQTLRIIGFTITRSGPGN